MPRQSTVASSPTKILRIKARAKGAVHVRGLYRKNAIIHHGRLDEGACLLLAKAISQIGYGDS